LAKFIQKNYNKNKVARILNEQPVPQFYTEDLSRYDLVPQEGLLTETQQQMFYIELRQAKAEGAPITWTMIFENAPMQMKDKLLKMMKEEEQRQQQAQQEQLKEKQLLDQMRMAKIDADLGRGAERRAQEEENRAGAALSRIKTAKEIEEMGFDRVLKFIDRAIAFEGVNQKKAMTRR